MIDMIDSGARDFVLVARAHTNCAKLWRFITT